VFFALWGASAYAQDQPAAATAAPMTAHGSVDVGYRWRDVDGNEDTYRQLYDLSDGLRLFGVDLRASGGTAPDRMFDVLTFNASAVGDPFPSLNARVKRGNAYDVRVNWRQISFFDVAPRTPASIDDFDTSAVTDRHSWNTDRSIGNVALTLTPKPRLQVTFGYDRVRRDGAIGTTRAVDFIGSPATWGSFARANPFPLTAPHDDTSQRFTGGVSFGRDRWTVHYKAGYQQYDEALALDPLTGPIRSINIADAATANERLQAVSWNQTRKLTTPSSELAFVVRPAPQFEWRGEYLFYRASGPYSIAGAFAGTARTTATAFFPYNVTVDAEGDGKAPTHVFGQGFSYRPSNYWGLDFDYRFSSMSSEMDSTVSSLLTGYPPADAAPAAANESLTTAWDVTLHTVRITGLLQPRSNLTIRPGLRFTGRDVVMTEDDIADPATTRDDTTWTPEISVSYRPRTWVAFRGAFRSTSNDPAYTRMSPSERTVGHIGVTLDPMEGLTVGAAFDRNAATLDTAGFSSRIHGGSVQASYAFNDRVTTFGSFDYRKLRATGDTTFLRGTAPIENIVMIDDETDKVWQGGLTLRVVAGLELTASGIYDRVTGADLITGEPPLYGPVSFPSGTISASYEVPRFGRVAFDVQRSHYYQDLLPLNDFKAQILTVRFTRGF
jgi:hypothetical protein